MKMLIVAALAFAAGSAIRSADANTSGSYIHRVPFALTINEPVLYEVRLSVPEKTFTITSKGVAAGWACFSEVNRAP